MKHTIILSVTSWIIIGCGLAGAGFVELSPDEKGDRIAVVKDGKVAYLPATRVNIGSGAVGGGSCRYIRRASNGDLYVTGPGLDIFRSTDSGHNWTKLPLVIPDMHFMSSFTILNDDTFLVSYMPPPSHEHKRMRMARSTDLGKTWKSYALEIDVSPCKYKYAWNGDMIQLADGTVLQTIDARVGPDTIHDEAGKLLPEQLRGGFLYVFRSHDEGKTWGEKSMIPGRGGEVHLLQLLSGKVLACVRKQYAHRIPGEPAYVLDLKKQHGYRPVIWEGILDDGERSSRVKNMFVSESYDNGFTWVNEQQVSGFMQCSGDMSYLENGTLVLQYLHRYPGGPAADISIRARVSYDDGKTWEPEEYILSDGENYPGGIAKLDGGMISMCPHKGQIQAVHWQPLSADKPALSYSPGLDVQSFITPDVDEQGNITVIEDSKTIELAATRVNMPPAPRQGHRHAPLRSRRKSIILQRAHNGEIYCSGNILGPSVLIGDASGRTWSRVDFELPGWGELVGFRILNNGDFVIVYEPAGGGHRTLVTARSTDAGTTWSMSLANLPLSAFTQICAEQNNIIELADGTLVMGIQVWGGYDAFGNKAPADHSDGLACIVKSTDSGRSWSQPTSISGLAGKTRLVRINSDQLLACVYQLKKGVINKHYLVESANGGRTWTNTRLIPSEYQPNGAHLSRLADGTVVLQFLHDKAPGTNPHNEWRNVESLRALISRDEGKTWDKKVYVIGYHKPPGANVAGGYVTAGAYLGDSIQLEDGSILTTCVNHVGRGMRLQAVIWRSRS